MNDVFNTEFGAHGAGLARFNGVRVMTPVIVLNNTKFREGFMTNSSFQMIQFILRDQN
jgi:hypothetical protein